MDLSVQLATVFKMSKYMKTWKNTSENYKKQMPFFQKFTEPKISYNIPWDFFPHFVRHISCEAKLFTFSRFPFPQSGLKAKDRKERKKKDWKLVIIMASYAMAHAKPPGPIPHCILYASVGKTINDILLISFIGHYSIGTD